MNKVRNAEKDSRQKKGGCPFETASVIRLSFISNQDFVVPQEQNYTMFLRAESAI